MTMADYMLLLYAPEATRPSGARRWADMPLWNEVTESLRDAGLLVANGPLHGPERRRPYGCATARPSSPTGRSR